MAEDLGPLKRSAQSISRLKDALHTLPRELKELKLDKLKIDISRVTDWQRRAVRLSIAVFFFGALGHCLEFPPGACFARHPAPTAEPAPAHDAQCDILAQPELHAKGDPNQQR